MNQIDRLAQKIERLATRVAPKLKPGFAIVNGMLVYDPGRPAGSAPASDKLKKAGPQRFDVVRKGGKAEEDRLLALVKVGDRLIGEVNGFTSTHEVIAVDVDKRFLKLRSCSSYPIRNVVAWADHIERPSNV